MTSAPDDRWWWWAGDAADVDAEGIYSHGECATREGVIAEILPDIEEGQIFCVVEAQFDQREPDGCEEFIPFAASRNQEFLIKRGGQAEPFTEPLP